MIFTNTEISKRLLISHQRVKRAARDFLPYDPQAKAASGYVRRHSFGNAFLMVLGIHLVSKFKLSIAETRQIIEDLTPWLTEHGMLPSEMPKISQEISNNISTQYWEIDFYQDIDPLIPLNLKFNYYETNHYKFDDSNKDEDRHPAEWKKEYRRITIRKTISPGTIENLRLQANCYINRIENYIKQTREDFIPRPYYYQSLAELNSDLNYYEYWAAEKKAELEDLESGEADINTEFETLKKIINDLELYEGDLSRYESVQKKIDADFIEGRPSKKTSYKLQTTRIYEIVVRGLGEF